MSNKIMVELPYKPAFRYPMITNIGLDNIFSFLAVKTTFSRIVIITDNTVKKHYGFRLLKSLENAGNNCLLLSFPPGEKFKSNVTKASIENKMLSHSLDRDTLILALGGGIVGDLAGFVAATYLRGVPYIQIPTTLLAMVDSSVGGKTAINTSFGKNKIGIVYQPIAVISDVSLLKTISKRHLISGLIEAIKIFLTYDAKSIYFIELNIQKILNHDTKILTDIVNKSVSIKADVVNRDEHENGERSILNFGHTIGHALEKISGYKMLHGYAVGYGILVEATISHAIGLLDFNHLRFIRDLFAKLGIRGKYLKQYPTSALIHATKNDNKARKGNVRYVLINSIGHTHIKDGNYIHPVNDIIVKQAILDTIAG